MNMTYFKATSILLGLLLILIAGINVFAITQADLYNQYNGNIPANVLTNSNITWCSASVAQFGDNDRLSLGIVLESTSFDCSCWNGDLVSETDFRDLMCENSQAGLLKQYKIQTLKIKPLCQETQQVYVYQDKNYVECSICPAAAIGQWQDYGCTKSNQLIQSQNSTGYLWDNTLSKCNSVAVTLFQITSSNGVCNIPVVNQFVKLESYWWVLLIIVIVLLFLILKYERWI